MDKYKVSFRKNNLNTTKVYMFESPNSVVFLKLYLITKSQLLDLIKNHYGIEINISDEHIFKDLNIPNSYLNLNHNEYNLLKCLGDLDNISIYSLISTNNKTFPISSPTDYLRNIFIGLKKSFNPYSEYIIIYYIYRLEGIKNYYDINKLTECFFKKSSKDLNDSNFSSTINSNTESTYSIKEKNMMAISEENENLNTNTIILNESTSSQKRIDPNNQTLKYNSCNLHPYIETPEKEQPNQYSYIFDLNHLPVFDEYTGEFFWTNNEANWRSARDSILKSEEINGKNISLNHGSIVSLSTSFINNNFQKNSKDIEAERRWNEFKKDGNSNTFINDLSNLLKNFENEN